ncbi:CJ090 protein, partial [Galbula dea]|nr:CJ090 protein [Galbula dea]
SLSSQNTTLISPLVISQMIDEKKAKANWSALPRQPMIPQPSIYPTKQSLANHGSVNLPRALVVLPSRLEIQASLGDTTSPSDSPITEENQHQKQQKGFAFITVTARRVAVGSSGSESGPGAVQEPRVVSLTSSKVPAALHCWPPPNQHVSPCSQSAPKWLFDPGNKENGISLQSRDGREKVPPSFTSCVHLQVSQHCPNTIYYLDKSLNICLDQPRMKCQKTHRSALSFKIKCSSARLTADGVDGIANGEPVDQTKLLGQSKTPHKSKLRADLTLNKEKTNEGCLGSEHPLQNLFVSQLPAFGGIPRRPHQVVTSKKDDAKQAGSYHPPLSLQLPKSREETGTQVLSGSKKQQCTVGRSSRIASGSPPVTGSKKAIAAATDGLSKKKDPSKDTSKSKEIQAQDNLQPKLSVSSSMCNIKASSRILSEENVHRQNHLLKSDYEFCGSSDKESEEEEEGDEQEPASRVVLYVALSPDATHERNDELTQLETRSQTEKTPPAPQTLREALEMHNPQFISRSQERLKRLERMVQLRKAQRSDVPSSIQGVLPLRKLSSTPTSSKKKQYTIPHPLS